MTMEANSSSENIDQPHGSSQCPYEKNVVTDPMTARVVLMFLRDLVDDQAIHARKLDGYPCPMLKCSSSAIGPLELIQHLLGCTELGKGEFECSKCSCWHQFPTNEKEWSEWSGWGSAAAGHQRKRSPGSKMKDTLTETLALRRRVSARKSSIGGASIDMTHSQLSITDTSAMSAPITSSSTSTASMESESTSTAVSSSFPLRSESNDWDGILKQQKVSSQMLSHRDNEAITALDFSPMGNFSSSLENACLALDSQPNQDYSGIREGELQFTRDISDYTQVYPHAIANSTSWITNPEALARPLPSVDPYFAVPVYGMLPQPRDSTLGVQISGTSKAVPLPGLAPDLGTKSPQQPVNTSNVDRRRSLLPSTFPYTAERRGSNTLPHTLQELMRPVATPGNSPQTWFPGRQHHLETSDFIDMNNINHQILSQQTQQDPISHHHHFNIEHNLDEVLTESVDIDMDGPQTPSSRRQSQLEDQAYFFAQAPIIIPRQGDLYTREPTEKGLFSDAEFETATDTTKPSSSIVSISSSGTPHDIPYTPASISGIPTPQHDICFSTMDDDMDPEDLICDQCAWKPQGVRENLRGYLRKHKNVHKGIRHHCDMPDCKKSFSRLDNLKTHRREKHGIDDPAQEPKAFAKSPTEFQHLPPAQHSFLPIKRTISMTSDTGERMQDAVKIVQASNNSPAHYPHYRHHHHQYHPHQQQQQHLAHVLRSAEAIAQAQSRQIQAQPHARAQAHAQAHAIAQAREQQEQHERAKFVNLQLQVPVQPPPLQPPPELLPETPRPDSKRNKDSPGLVSYRGVSSQHAALWPAMQF